MNNMVDEIGVVGAGSFLQTVINEKHLKEATDTLNRYKQGKANFDARVTENEEWYRLRHWANMRRKKEESAGKQVEPTSAWLYNCIVQKHADMMDNFPEANILPRERNDEEEAKRLSQIVPVILEQCEFEDTYDEACMDLLKYGAAVFGVFWDSKKYNGLGDVDVRRINLLNVFTEPGIKDIQQSRNVFTVELVDNDLLLEQYPELRNKLSGATVRPVEFIHDESIDTSTKSAVIDWYYKKNVNGRQVLHYVKYVNDTVLYATENQTQPLTDSAGNVAAPAPAEVGLYEDGNYPFVVVPFNETEGSPYGFGIIDIGKSSQEWIDRGNAALMKSMQVNAKPRYMVREDCGINEEDFADLEKDVIKYTGSSPADVALPVQVQPVAGVYVNILQYKIDELKEVTGNREVSTGGTTSGVTAASAIAALQEAAGKGSRDINKKAYRGFRQIVNLVIERIRQFYVIQRQFRIIGERGAIDFINYSNIKLQKQAQGMDFDVDGGYRIPVMDIEVTAQKSSPYSKMSQNELALQLYGQGFFLPSNADNSLAALEMMDFDDKDKVIERIAMNGTLFQQVQMLTQQLYQMAKAVDGIKGTNMADQIAAQAGGGMPQQSAAEPTEIAEGNSALGGDERTGTEAKNTKKARERTAELSSPR